MKLGNCIKAGTILMVLIASDFASAQSAQLCEAPAVERYLGIKDPSCEQKWRYHLQRIAVIQYVYLQDRILSSRERASLSVYETVDQAIDIVDFVSTIAGGYKSIFKDPNDAAKAFKIAYASEETVAALVLSDETHPYLSELRDVISTSIEAGVDQLTKGAVSEATPTAALVKLANEMGFLWNSLNSLASRNTVIVIQDYMSHYYKFGGSDGLVAASYGLPRTATTKDILRDIANMYGFGRTEFRPTTAERAVAALKGQIDIAAAECLKMNTCWTSVVASTANARATRPATPMPAPTTPVSDIPTKVPRQSPDLATDVLIIESVATTTESTGVSEVMSILGALKDNDRYSALSTLNNNNKIHGPLTPADINRISANMETWRPQVMSMLANRVKDNATIDDLVILLGVLKENDRYSALSSLNNNNKIHGPLIPADINRIVAGMEIWRPQVMAMLANRVKDNATVDDLVSLLGVLKENERYSALSSLNNNNKIHGPLTPVDINRIVAGMETWRPQVIAMLANRMK